MRVSPFAVKPSMTKRTAGTAAALLVALLVSVGCSDNDPEKPLASAREYLQKNDLKSATIQVKNALQIKPDLGEARFLLGTILLREGNASAAEIELRKALAAKYPEKRVVPELAISLLMQGQNQKLVDEFGEARLEDAGADASLQTTLAAAYGALGKAELFEAALTAALKADPHHSPALILRARQKAADRDFDGALATVEEVLASDARNVDAWTLKGDLLLYAKGNADDGLAAYRKAVEVRPDSVPAHFALMTALLQQDKLDDAAKQLSELKQVAAGHPRTRYLEAQLAYKKKDYKLARELAQRLLLTSPSPRNLELAGLVELQLNSLDQAEGYLAGAVRAAPELRLARRLLVTTYLRSGQPAKALATLNDAMGKDGLDPEPVHGRGPGLPAKRRREDGRRVFRQGVEARSEQRPQTNRPGGDPLGRWRNDIRPRRTAEHRRLGQGNLRRPGIDQRRAAARRISRQRSRRSPDSRQSSPISRWRPTSAGAFSWPRRTPLRRAGASSRR